MISVLKKKPGRTQFIWDSICLILKEFTGSRCLNNGFLAC